MKGFLKTFGVGIATLSLFAAAAVTCCAASESIAPDKGCASTYQLEDGLTYYRVPVTKLDGHVGQLDVEVGSVTYLYCDETALEDRKILMSCAVEDQSGLSGVATFVYAMDENQKVSPPMPPFKAPKLAIDETREVLP